MSTIRRCVYCGGLARGALTCRGHSDLPALDPFYRRELREATTEHWTPGPTSFAAERLIDRLREVA
jgi:hypothetical protein